MVVGCEAVDLCGGHRCFGGAYHLVHLQDGRWKVEVVYLYVNIGSYLQDYALSQLGRPIFIFAVTC